MKLTLLSIKNKYNLNGTVYRGNPKGGIVFEVKFFLLNFIKRN